MTTSTRMAIEESMNNLPRQERNRETRLKKKRDAVREGQAKERMARVTKRRDWKHDAVFLYSHLSTEEDDNTVTDVIFIRPNDGIQKEEEPSSENDEWIVIDSEPERESSNRPASVWWRIL